MKILANSFFFIFVFTIFVPKTSQAIPPTGELEAGAVMVTGNKDSESYSSKVKLVFAKELNIYTATGRYIKSISDGLESARNWELGARYERELSEKTGIFFGQKAESDIYSGYTQRDSTDLGLKYLITKKQNLSWKAEIGGIDKCSYDLISITKIRLFLAVSKYPPCCRKVHNDHNNLKHCL